MPNVLAVPLAIVVPSGRPLEPTRCTAIEIGAPPAHVTACRRNTVNVPAAPTVTICASVRPPAPPNGTELPGPKPCCSRTDTAIDRSCVTTCAGDAESVTCTVKLDVPVAVAKFAKQPLVCS